MTEIVIVVSEETKGEGLEGDVGGVRGEGGGREVVEGDGRGGGADLVEVGGGGGRGGEGRRRGGDEDCEGE